MVCLTRLNTGFGVRLKRQYLHVSDLYERRVEINRSVLLKFQIDLHLPSQELNHGAAPCTESMLWHSGLSTLDEKSTFQ